MYTDLHTLSLHDSLPISFSVYEQAGLVRVCLRANALLPLLADCLYRYAGTAHVSLSHQEYLDALYDDPGLVLAIRGVGSEERRVGKECVSTCRSRWSPAH